MNSWQSKTLFVVAIFVALYMPVYIGSFATRNSQVAGCERNNDGIRTPVFTFFQDAQNSRLAQAKITTGEEKQVNLDAAKDYKRDADMMIEAAEEDGVLKEEGSPIVDCEKAFKKPFPFSWM